MTNDDIEALRQATDPGSRASAKKDVSDEFENDLVEALGERQKKGAQRTISMWDAEIAALVDALEDHPDEMERLIANAADVLGTESEDIDRSEALRLLVKLGLRESNPELFDAWRDAVAENARGV